VSISQLAMTAKKRIEAAWLTGPAYDLATQAAEALESAQLLQSPETVAEFRAEVLREAADLFESYGRAFLDGGIMTGAEAAEKLRALAGGTEEKDTRKGESTPQAAEGGDAR
jgi:hypothetical protein